MNFKDRVRTVLPTIAFVFSLLSGAYLPQASGQESEKVHESPFLIDFTDVSLPKGVERVDAYHLKVTQGVVDPIDVSFASKVKEWNTPKYWIRANVLSSRTRSAVYVRDGYQEYFSYHTGDGKSQVLLAEVVAKKPFRDAVVHLVPSEAQETAQEVIFGPIVVSVAGDSKLPVNAGFSAQDWVRTNNPDPQNSFDRYSSQLKNFTITVAGALLQTWEKFFVLGVNDRANTGDYFCYPDDVLFLVSKKSGQVKSAYLGLLPWERKIEQEGENLTVRFYYDGPLIPSPLGKKFPTIQGAAAQHWDVPESQIVHLSKEYRLRTSEMKAIVDIHASLDSFAEAFDAAWIVHDAAFMDFADPQVLKVHSLLNGKSDFGGVCLSHDKYNCGAPGVFDAVQYRLREQHSSIASAYKAKKADFKFILPIGASWDILNTEVAHWINLDSLQLNRHMARDNLAVPWTYGFGYRFASDKNLEAQYEMHFIDGFDSAEELAQKVKQEVFH